MPTGAEHRDRADGAEDEAIIRAIPAAWRTTGDSPMSQRQEVTAALTRALADYAELPLGADREAVVAPILEAWVKDANALSRKMSAEQYIHLVPATVFAHPVEPEDGL